MSKISNIFVNTMGNDTQNLSGAGQFNVSKTPDDGKVKIITISEWWERYQVIRSGGYV